MFKDSLRPLQFLLFLFFLVHVFSCSMRLVLILSLILLFCGCTSDSASETTSTTQGIVCLDPYILVGNDCCLDKDGNGICDRDETSTSVMPAAPSSSTVSTSIATTSMAPTTTARVTTTVKQTTTTEAPTTTTTTLHSAYECVQAAGYDKDSFILVYSPGCGGSSVESAAEAASAQKGVGLTKIDISVLSPREINALECFLGMYYEGNANFMMCPRIMCPKTGKVEEVTGRKPVSVQMRSFAGSCV